jgi:ABC-type phosphate transport system substrate-binding protein
MRVSGRKDTSGTTDVSEQLLNQVAYHCKNRQKDAENTAAVFIRFYAMRSV